MEIINNKFELVCWADNVQSDFFSRGGKLFITKTSMVFKPHVIDKILFAKKISILISAIKKLTFVDGPYNVSDELYIELINGKIVRFRVKDANPIIEYIKRNVDDLPVECSRRVAKKRLSAFYLEIMPSMLIDLVLMATVYLPIVMYVYILVDCATTNKYLMITGCFNEDRILFVLGFLCQIFTSIIYIAKVYSSNSTSPKKIKWYALILIIGPIVVPMLHALFLRERVRVGMYH